MRAPGGGEPGDEEARLVAAFAIGTGAGAVPRHDLDASALRQHGADLPGSGRDLVRAQHRERVAVIGRGHSGDRRRCASAGSGEGSASALRLVLAAMADFARHAALRPRRGGTRTPRTGVSIQSGRLIGFVVDLVQRLAEKMQPQEVTARRLVLDPKTGVPRTASS